MIIVPVSPVCGFVPTSTVDVPVNVVQDALLSDP